MKSYNNSGTPTSHDIVHLNGNKENYTFDSSSNGVIVASNAGRQYTMSNIESVSYMGMGNTTETFDWNVHSSNVVGMKRSCKEILADNPGAASGRYLIKPDGHDFLLAVCDMDFDGGGWTLLQGGKIDKNTLDSDFIDFSTTKNNGTSDLEEFYYMPDAASINFPFSESRSVHNGNTSQYENHIVYGGVTSRASTASEKTISSYKILNSKYGINVWTPLTNCVSNTSTNGSFICDEGQETQNPWYQFGKVRQHDGYGAIHTCIRLVDPNDSLNNVTDCSEVHFSNELFLGSCQGALGWKNYITHPDCQFRNSETNYYRWAEWVR